MLRGDRGAAAPTAHYGRTDLTRRADPSQIHDDDAVANSDAARLQVRLGPQRSRHGGVEQEQLGRAGLDAAHRVVHAIPLP